MPSYTITRHLDGTVRGTEHSALPSRIDLVEPNAAREYCFDGPAAGDSRWVVTVTPEIARVMVEMMDEAYAEGQRVVRQKMRDALGLDD